MYIEQYHMLTVNKVTEQKLFKAICKRPQYKNKKNRKKKQEYKPQAFLLNRSIHATQLKGAK